MVICQVTIVTIQDWHQHSLKYSFEKCWIRWASLLFSLGWASLLLVHSCYPSVTFSYAFNSVAFISAVNSRELWFCWCCSWHHLMWCDLLYFAVFRQSLTTSTVVVNLFSMRKWSFLFIV